jgi:hypothetical protein
MRLLARKIGIILDWGFLRTALENRVGWRSKTAAPSACV